MRENKREIILSTALHLFNERGFHNTPTSLIAKEAKMSVGTLFNTFSTKEELIKELYIDIKKKLKVFYSDRIDLSGDNLKKFTSLWRTAVKWNLSHPDEFKFLGQFSHSPYINTIEKDIESFGKMKEFIIGLVSNQDVCTKHPKFTFNYIQSILNATTEYIRNNEIDDEDTFIDQTFELFYQGFNK